MSDEGLPLRLLAILSDVTKLLHAAVTTDKFGLTQNGAPELATADKTVDLIQELPLELNARGKHSRTSLLAMW